MTLDETLLHADDVLKNLEKYQQFHSKHGYTPPTHTGVIINQLRTLADSIPEIPAPATHNEVITAELKRRLEGEATNLEINHAISATPQQIIQMLALPQTDLDNIGPWLHNNKERVSEAIERQYQSETASVYIQRTPLDIPNARVQSEQVAANAVKKYHRVLGRFFEQQSEVGHFLRDVNAEPTTVERAYYNALTNTLAIPIPQITYNTADGVPSINDQELIRIYGHEGMGHALQHVVSRTKNIPLFLQKSSFLTIGTEESITQHFEKVIFEDLKNAPEIQKELDIHHRFAQIYQENLDKELIQEYFAKRFQYGILVLADKKFGDPNDQTSMQRRLEALLSIDIFPGWSNHLINSNRQNYDIEGNLNPQLVSELRYAAQPVKRVLEAFAQKGMNYNSPARSTIDSTLLSGFWTPTGFEQNAAMIIQQQKQ